MTLTNELFETPQQMIDVGHSKVAHWTFGSGPNLVLIHGWPLNAATFRNIVPNLAKHFTCHCIDLPGAGSSEWDRDSNIEIRAHVDTVCRVIEHLSLSSFSLLGHDSGGAIARMVAARSQKKVQAIVLSNTEITKHHPLMLKLFVGIAKLPGGATIVRQVFKYRWLRKSWLALGGCFSEPRWAESGFKQLFVDPLVQSKRTLEGQLRLARSLDMKIVDGFAAMHGKISAPVLMLWGQDDGYFPLKKARPMLREFSGQAQLVALPGKLFVHEERAEEFSARALEFLLVHT